jgi:exodeoxyribonuclease VII large subunit
MWTEPTKNPEPTKYNVCTLVERLSAAVPEALRILPRGPIKLLGEVIAIRRTDSFIELTLLDAKDEDETTAFAARLPPSFERIPEKGKVAGLIGHLEADDDGTEFEFFLRVIDVDKHNSDGRLFERRTRCLQRLIDQVSTRKVTRLPMPLRRVALVTGHASRAKRDFQERLHRNCKKGRIEVDVVSVRLRDPASIAAGIRRAAQDEKVDAIVIARGGGPVCELHRFSRPDVLEAIADAVCRKYVLTAIGHTEDQTLADQLASHVEGVPASAAVYLLSQCSKFRYQVEHGPRTATHAAPQVAEAANGHKGDSAPPVCQAARATVVSRVRSWLSRWTRRAVIFGAGATIGLLAAPAVKPHRNPVPAESQTEAQLLPSPPPVPGDGAGTRPAKVHRKSGPGPAQETRPSR